MDEALIGAIAIVLVALISFHGGRVLNKAQKNLLDIDTLGKLTKQILDLQNEQNKLHDEQQVLRNRVEEFEDKNRILWGYVIELVAFIKRKGHVPPNPPEALETNPKLMRVLKK